MLQPKPKFNPNKSYEVIKKDKPKFNPNLPFEEVKKKDIGESNIPIPQQNTTESPLAGGSLATQEPTKEIFTLKRREDMPALTQEGFEKAMSKKTSVPTDMSGKPIISQVKKQKETRGDYLDNVGTNLMAGVNDVDKIIASIPETVYNLFSIPQNAISYATGLDISTNSDKLKKNIGITNPVLDYYKDEGKKLEKEISDFNENRYKSSSIYENVKEGNYQDAFELLGSGIVRSAPTSIAIMAGGATLTTAELATATTAAFYNQNLEGLQEDNPNASDIENNIKALGMSAAEGVFSSIGQGQIGAVYRDIIKKEGVEVGSKVFKDGLVQMYKGALEKYGVPIGLLGEGIEESATQITQNMISGKPAFEGAADAFILGGGSGVMFTAPISLKNAKDRIKNKITEIDDKKKINTILESSEGTFIGLFDVSKDSEINENQLNIASLEKSRDLLTNDLNASIKKGEITEDQAKQSLYVFDKTKQITGQLRGVDIDNKSKVKVANLLKERDSLSEKINGKDEALSVLEKQRISDINDKIKETILKSKEDAVQEQGTTEVPVQSETITSETMETGVPESGPEVVTEQVTQEEVTEPLRDIESTAKALNKDLVNSIEESTNILFPKNENTNLIVSERYHKAKQDGTNPELVEDVETLLAPEVSEEIIAEPTETQVELTPSQTIITEQADIPPVAEITLEVKTPDEEIKELGKEYGKLNKEYKRNKVLQDKFAKEKDDVGYNNQIEILDGIQEKMSKISGEIEEKEIKLKKTKANIIPVVELTPIQAQESRVESAQSLLDEAKTKAAKKKAMTDLVREQGKLAEIKAFEKVSLTEAKSEMSASEVDSLLDLDTKDETKLKRVLGYLDSLDDVLNFNPNELNDVTRVMTIATAKLVIKTLKALVKTGITLQEALKKVANDNNLKVSDVVKGIDALSEIAKIPTGYNDLMTKAEKLIVRQKKKGISDKKIISNLDTMIRNAPIYLDANTNDAQRKIMEREARARMGVAPRKAPSIGRVLGVLNDIKNVSREEKLKIISRIRDLSKDAAKDLIEEIRELASGGKITPTQSINIIAKFSKVNMLNEISVSNFVDYMAKVFADAEYGNKISIAKDKLKAAKKNINTKIGIANGLAFPLQTLFSINPSLIPINNLERYMELVKMFSDRKAILQLEEISKVTKDVNDILDVINNEQSLVPELAYRLNNSRNQVLKDGELDYAATIKKMIAEGEVTQDEADLMVKYKKEINPQEGKAKKTEAELEKEKKELEAELKKSTVNASDLPTRDERNIAKRIAEHLKKPFVSQLNNDELKNLVKAIDNINNGYLPHQALLILEKLDSFYDSKIEVEVIDNANLSVIGKLYNSVKGKLTGRNAEFEMIRRAPLFNIDQVLGNFKTQDLFNALLGKSAQAEARFSSELKTIEEKIKKAQDKVAKSFGFDPLKSTISSYKIKTYLIQLENDTNPGDNRVNPAAKYIEATIKHINKLKSQYNENDVKILEDILKDFSTDGSIDIKKLYNSFNSAEKDAIKVLQELKKSESEKAEFTGAVIRGKRINPLNNHTHISVLSEDSKSDLDSGASFAESYNNSLMPSTKAKSLMERTPGVKPINFDAYTTAHKSAKYVLLDYYLTSPIRTARKSIKETEVELEKDGKMSKEQRRIFNAVNDSFELAVRDLVMNSYVQSSFGADMVNYISKQGYRAVLAGLGRSGVELISNLGFVAFDPFTFYKGVEYTSILLSEDGPAIMNNVGSVQTNRVYASGLSGRMIDTSILNQSIGTKSSKTQGRVINKAQQIWNLTGKKGLNAVELTADALITSPDKLVMRPYWMGSFVVEFKKQTGSEPDFEKIAENNEGYMNDNQEAIESARDVADRKSALMGATKNGFTGLLRGKTRTEDNAGAAIVKNFNSFMTNFMIYEYTAAKTGVMAAVGQGTMTRAEGAAVLGGVITRMTVYNLLIKAATAGVSGLLGLAFGGDDEEEEEKTVNQMLGQSLTSTFATLILGRDFGNASKTLMSYGFEEFVTKEYLEGLRTGEYDPYKDSVLFNSLQTNKKTGEINIYENIPNFMGSYSPAVKTSALAFKVFSADDKKTAEALERQEKERYVRIPLEILGNAGLVPLYKEIRKSVMDDIYKDLKDKNGSDITKEELKKLDPKMYQIMYGKD